MNKNTVFCIVVGSIFYFLSYYVVPELLLKKRFLMLLISLAAIYYFYSFVLLIEFSLLPKILEIPGRGYQIYSSRILESGVIGIFTFKHAAEILLDLSYMLSPSLIIKLIIALASLSTQTLKLQMDNVNLELAFLKSQLNPHFLFNTLNNVYSLALTKSDHTADMVLKLSDLMRYTLYDSNAQKVPLDKELQFFKNYIELERMRHSDRVTIELDVQCGPNELNIAPLILFPFIENACKHGVNTSVSQSWVAIRIWVEDITLHVLVENSLFQTPSNLKSVGGIGIQNAVKRLNMLYADSHKLDIRKLENTFHVGLQIKLA
jgi:LytS/YehU family sensor histidine kinase